MTKITCDKCGKEIIKFPWQNIIFPNYVITVVRSANSNIETVDLCSDCVKDFEAWLNNKGRVESESI